MSAENPVAAKAKATRQCQARPKMHSQKFSDIEQDFNFDKFAKAAILLMKFNTRLPNGLFFFAIGRKQMFNRYFLIQTNNYCRI